MVRLLDLVSESQTQHRTLEFCIGLQEVFEELPTLMQKELIVHLYHYVTENNSLKTLKRLTDLELIIINS